MRILGIVEVEKLDATHDAHRDGGNLPRERNALDAALLARGDERLVERHPGTGDGCGTGSTICLDNVAVHGYRELTKVAKVTHGAQRAPHQAFDLHRAALATLVLARRPTVGRRREHGILCRDPAILARTAPLGHAVRNGRRAEHARVAKLCQARAVGVLHDAGGQFDRAHLVNRPAKAALGLGGALLGHGVSRLPALDRRRSCNGASRLAPTGPDLLHGGR